MCPVGRVANHIMKTLRNGKSSESLSETRIDRVDSLCLTARSDVGTTEARIDVVRLTAVARSGRPPSISRDSIALETAPRSDMGLVQPEVLSGPSSSKPFIFSRYIDI